MNFALLEGREPIWNRTIISSIALDEFLIFHVEQSFIHFVLSALSEIITNYNIIRCRIMCLHITSVTYSYMCILSVQQIP